jgi:hypothetical protein
MRDFAAQQLALRGKAKKYGQPTHIGLKRPTRGVASRPEEIVCTALRNARSIVLLVCILGLRSWARLNIPRAYPARLLPFGATYGICR